jgi:DinB superfamily
VKNLFLILLIGSNPTFCSYSQDVKSWTETDREYLLGNLVRSKEELVKETKGLTKEQWSFKELPDRWSINQVVEHIATWELLLDHEISKALTEGPKPDLYKTAKPDSLFLGFIMEEKPQVSTDYTRPFTYTVPMGINDLQNNIARFLKMRGESIAYVKKAKEDLRSYNLKDGSPNLHQRYITLFGHGDRHLRQIRKIKQHPDYPR